MLTENSRFKSRYAHQSVSVKEPFINTEEQIDRFVGRRTRSPDPLSLASGTQADARAWREAFGGVRVPKGVHRFKTHQEADEWLWRMIARPNQA